MKNDELTIKKERVLAAAEKCPTAKAALMEIFPDAFKKKEEWKDITSLCGMKKFNDIDSRVTGMTLGVYVPMSGREDFYCPFMVVVNPVWRKGSENRFSKEGNPIGIDDDFEFKVEDGRIWRRFIC